MVDVLLIVLRFLHIVFAIAWIGAVAFTVFVLRSAMGRVGMPARKETMRQLIPVAIHFVPMSALLTIGFGALLYLVMGDFDSNLLIGRTWGLIILAALILAVALFTFGMTVVIGASSRTLVHLKEDTCTHANEMGELQRTFNRGQVVALVWGLAILALMVIATEGV